MPSCKDGIPIERLAYERSSRRKSGQGKHEKELVTIITKDLIRKLMLVFDAVSMAKTFVLFYPFIYSSHKHLEMLNLRCVLSFHCIKTLMQFRSKQNNCVNSF